LLLSYKYKITGLIIVVISLALTALYFLAELRFEVPVLAIFSSYVEPRFFAVFKTNFADETIILLLLSGLVMLVLSKEKNERDVYKQLRTDAMIKSLGVNTVFIFLSVLFVYGSGFIAITIINLFMPFLLYLLFFYLLKKSGVKKIR